MVFAPASLVTGVLVCFIVPSVASGGIPVIRWIHHVAVAVLGLYLLATSICHTEIILRRRQPNGSEQLQVAYRRWWAMTETLPGPAALSIWWSGLRLIWENPGISPLNTPWLFWVIIGISFFFLDGLSFYLPTLRRWSANRGPRIAVGGIRFKVEWWAELQLWFHALSYPVVLGLAIARPKMPSGGPMLGSLVHAILPHASLRLSAVTAVGVELAFCGFALLLLRLVERYMFDLISKK